MHKAELLEKYGYWRGPDEQEYGYANDWDLFSRWVSAKVEWLPTKQYTVEYNIKSSHQTIEQILKMYDDQN